MSNVIANYGDLIPKVYKGNSFGINKKLNIQKLFRAIVLGPSYSGKNNLVFDIIFNSPNVFAHVHIIARNPDQELYNYLRDKLGSLITVYPADAPPSVDSIKKIPGELQLVIIDDYSNDKKMQKELFSHYFTRGRHKLLSTIFLSHSYFATDKMIRLNSEYVMILKANSKRDLKMLLKDFNIPGVDEVKLIKAYENATKEKGQMLMVDSVQGELRYNFGKKIDPEDL